MCKMTNCNEVAGPSGKCPKCNRAAVRVSKMIQNLDQDDKDAFEAMDDKQRQEFRELSKNAYGDQLACLINEHIERVKENYSDDKWVGTGDYYDDVELAQKYENNPKRLEAVRKYGERYTCPKTKIEFIEDIRYQSVRMSGTRTADSSGHRCDADPQKLKKAKIIKPKKEPAEEGGEPNKEPEPKELSEANKTALGKLQEGIDAAMAAVQLELDKPSGEEGAKIEKMLPSYVLETANTSKLKGVNQKNTNELVLTNAQCLDFKSLSTEGKDMIKDLKECAKLLKVQIGQAEKAMKKAAATPS